MAQACILAGVVLGSLVVLRTNAHGPYMAASHLLKGNQSAGVPGMLAREKSVTRFAVIFLGVVREL